MNDRARELAKALLADPWVDDRLRNICRNLLMKWAKEDSEVLPLTPEEEYARFY